MGSETDETGEEGEPFVEEEESVESEMGEN